MNERVGLLPGVERDPQGRRSVDVASWRMAIYTLVMTALATVQAAAQEKETPTPESVDALVGRLVQQLDDDAFGEREKASHIIRQRIIEELNNSNPPDEDLRGPFLKRINPKMLPEPRMRLAKILEFADTEAAATPTTLPPGEMSAVTALDLLSRGGTRIVADESIGGILEKMQVRLYDRRSLTHVVAQLCNESGAVPVRQRDGSIVLTKATSHARIAATDWMVGVAEDTEDGSAPTVSLFLEPGKAMLIDLKSATAGKPAEDQSAQWKLAGCDKPAWKGNGCAITRSLSATPARNIRATIAHGPKEYIMPMGSDAFVELGFQRLRANGSMPNAQGRWTTRIEGTVFGHIPWPPTPYAWDVLTYEASHGNRYELMDHEGRTIEATVHPTTFNQRAFTVDIDSNAIPAGVRVRAFTKFDEVDLEAPSFRRWKDLTQPAQDRPAPPVPPLPDFPG